MIDRKTLLRELEELEACIRALRTVFFFAAREGVFPRWVVDGVTEQWVTQNMSLLGSLGTPFPSEQHTHLGSFLTHRVHALDHATNIEAVKIPNPRVLTTADDAALLEARVRLESSLGMHQLIAGHAQQFGWYPRWERDPDFEGGVQRCIHDQRLSVVLRQRANPTNDPARQVVVDWLSKLSHTPDAPLK